MDALPDSAAAPALSPAPHVPTDAPAAPRAAEAQALAERVQREVARVVVGLEREVEACLVALLAGGHVLIEGPPGVAKTLLVRTLATALGGSFGRIQFTPDLMPADITGTSIYRPNEGSFRFQEGPVFAALLLADEINRAPAKTQAALLEAMQERQVTIEGDRFQLPQPFMVLATQNPIDLEGTYPLPEAQIDRFLLHIPMGYPTHAEEVAMLETHNAEAPVARPLLDVNDFVRLQSIAARVHVEHDLYEYAVTLSAFTRTHARVTLGASPRATLSLIQAAKGAAVLAGRPFATPDDIRELVPPGSPIVCDDARGRGGTRNARAAVVSEAIARVGCPPIGAAGLMQFSDAPGRSSRRRRTRRHRRRHGSTRSRGGGVGWRDDRRAGVGLRGHALVHLASSLRWAGDGLASVASGTSRGARRRF
jgi:MoxR-like ATPase